METTNLDEEEEQYKTFELHNAIAEIYKSHDKYKNISENLNE